MDASIVMWLKRGYLTNIWTINMHGEKLHLLKPHYSITIYQKTTHIQLSLGYYNYYAIIPLEIWGIDKEFVMPKNQLVVYIIVASELKMDFLYTPYHTYIYGEPCLIF
jgi:hypothetical protein